MNFSESISTALSSLRINKMRSFLTLLGVIIGIAAVIAILTLGASVKKQFSDGLEDLGVNNFMVDIKARPESQEEPTDNDIEQAPTVSDPNLMLTPDMLDQISAQMGTDIDDIVIGDTNFHAGTTFRYREDGLPPTTTSETILQPVNDGFVNTSANTVVAGRNLTREDMDAARPVAMVNSSMVDTLFGGKADEAVGSIISFDDDRHETLDVTIVGVYKERDSGALFSAGDGDDDSMLIPYPLEAFLGDTPGSGEVFPSISVAASNDADKTAVQHRLEDTVEQMYAEETEAIPYVHDASEDLNTFNQVLSTISLAVAAIGGLSLLVGGVSVMNIMLITVTERTREIGVRKALGATRRNIRAQFVIEAVIVCLVGGLIGVIIGSVIGMIGAHLLGTFVLPPVSGIVISLLFSLAIGVFFGYYPAGKAAKMDPIEALRYE